MGAHPETIALEPIQHPFKKNAIVEDPAAQHHIVEFVFLPNPEAHGGRGMDDGLMKGRGRVLNAMACLQHIHEVADQFIRRDNYPPLIF